MKKLWLVIGVLLSVFFLGCSEIKDWSDPADNIPPGEITDIRVKNTNGGAVIHYRLPSDNDLLGAKAVFTFSENEEPMEVYASAFKDSIVLEGYANTEEHIVQLYAIDKSNNLSQPVSVTIQPLTPPISLIRQTLTAQETFSGVRAIWKNTLKKPIAVSLYTFDASGDKVLFERHYSSAENGGYTFRNFEAVEQPFYFELSDRWDHVAAPLDTVLTPLFETQIKGMEGTRYVWDLYDYDNSIYRGDPIQANAGSQSVYRGRVRNLFDGNTWDNSAYFYFRPPTMNQYVPGASSSAYPSPNYVTFDLGVPAKYSRFKYYTRGRTPVYSAWSWYEFEVWGTNNPKKPNEIGDGSQADNLKYWTSWPEAGGTDAWKEDWEKLADCEIKFPSGTPGNAPQVESAEDIAFVMDGFGFDIDPDKTGKAFRYIRFVLKKNNTDNVPYIQWSELQFWGSYE
ncbi:DUF4959 domain-containing protein [Parapedobacter sp. SGR-10]|uniref:DUF4959 domain-containing protein n=1 Tax=Parapedobacter sp. SGR-10 TaxID=2710879 RepID=UPI0013D864B1|nr:DUF4959 domain-containing protein [Parapedobacter sp. SGR-10]NGF55187.1 DUF4959 domain-containing protein [Parapedobacter sp. SGR-10]